MKCPKCENELTKDDLFIGFCPKCHSIISDKIIRQYRRKELREKMEAKEEAEKREKIENTSESNKDSMRKKERKEEKDGSNKDNLEKSNLIHCKECKKLISPSAKICPYCGAPTTRGMLEDLATALHSLGCLFTLIGLFLICAVFLASC